MDIKALLADQMGFFTPYDIGGVVISLLFAAVLGFVLAMLAGADGAQKKQAAVLAAVVAAAVALVRASIPLSIALVAVALFAGDRSPERSRQEAMLRLAAAAIGVGCGSSAAIVTAVLALPLGLLIRWAAGNAKN